MGKTAQLNMLEAEKNRMLSIMTTQYEQQFTQQKLSIEQAWKQQHSQLEMAQAQQYQMAVDMQKSMAKAYGSAFAGGAPGAKAPAAGGKCKSPAGPPKGKGKK